jgi:transcriptional regulator with GAF, ATPase, and Fis domain
MNARLVAISGPLEGATFPIQGELSIGRDRQNTLAIEDRVLSRRHCAIQESDGKCSLHDLGSSNGTYVNGLPVTMRMLNDGDQITAGQSLFLFACGAAAHAGASAGAVELDRGGINPLSTVMLKPEDAIYLRPEEVPEIPGAGKNLRVLLAIGSAISSIRDLETLEQRLLEAIFDVIPAERGAILLPARNAGEFDSVCYWSRVEDNPSMRVSHAIIERVMREGVAVLSNTVLEDTGIELTQSLLEAQISALVAVPLIAFKKVLGVIYLDSRDRGARFEEDHLQLLTGIAGIAAAALETALLVGRLEEENHKLKAEINIQHDMVGTSPRIRQVFDFIAKAAPSASTVLVRGESGTGKELVARAIHRNSPRASKPFVAINCAALTESLLESELFGHEKGSFTGAVVQKRGKLEEAAGGSMFLDEVGELAQGMQAKLLRVLQEREFERVGGLRAIKADIRLIAATNRDLEEAVAGGTFRRDLYYRLNVVSVLMPALHDRRDDILILANYFVRKHCRNTTRQIRGISPDAAPYLLNYDWPGNVRELENAIERAVVLGSTEWILPDDLPESIMETEVEGSAAPGSFHELVKEAKKQIVLKTLERCGGNYIDAAKALNLHTSNFHRLIRTLNLRSEVKKRG